MLFVGFETVGWLGGWKGVFEIGVFGGGEL